MASNTPNKNNLFDKEIAGIYNIIIKIIKKNKKVSTFFRSIYFF